MARLTDAGRYVDDSIDRVGVEVEQNIAHLGQHACRTHVGHQMYGSCKTSK